MNTFLDKLNLRPQERRIVVAIAFVVFVVLNLLLVRPHFGDWGRVKGQLQDARRTMIRWNAEIKNDLDPKDGYKVQLDKLEQQQGPAAKPMSEQIQLQKTIGTQANNTGVLVNSYQPVNTRIGGPTNEFFEEQSIQINVDSKEEDLVNFLFNIGSDASMIRVRQLDVRPGDANRYRLRGTLTLTANYQKKLAVKEAPKAAPAAAKSPAVLPAQGTAPGSKSGTKL